MKKILVLVVVALLFTLGCNKDAAKNPDKQAHVVSEKSGVADQKQVKETHEKEKKPAPPNVETAKDGPLYKGKPASFWIKQLKDRDVSFRLEAVNALAEIVAEDRRVFHDLISVLKDKNSQVREAGEKALESLSLEGDLPLLAKTLETEQDKNIRLFVIGIIGNLGPTATPLLPLLQICATDHDQDILLASKQAIELIRIFDPTDEQIRVAAKAIEEIGGRYYSKTDRGPELYLEQHLRTKQVCHTFAIRNAGDLKMFPIIPFVFELDLSGSKVTDLGIREIKKQRNLTGLYLHRCSEVGDSGLKVIREFKRLSTLFLNGTHVGNAGMEDLKELTMLSALGLGGTKVTDEGLKNLRHLRKLIYLDLSSTGVTDTGLRELKTLPNLAELHLRDAAVTEAGMKDIKELKKISVLTLYNTRVHDSGVTELAALTQLRVLNLGKTQVTGVGMKELRQLKNLSTLYLYDTFVTDSGLKDIKEIKSLTVLYLNRTNVTDVGAMELKELKNLTVLDLGHTQVTEAGLNELRKALPKCIIVYSKPMGQ